MDVDAKGLRQIRVLYTSDGAADRTHRLRIARWRLAQSVVRTRALRPELRQPLAPLRVICAAWPADGAKLARVRRDLRKAAGGEPWLIGVDDPPHAVTPRFADVSGALDYLRERDQRDNDAPLLLVAGWRQMRACTDVAGRLDAVVDAEDLREIDLATVSYTHLTLPTKAHG